MVFFHDYDIGTLLIIVLIFLLTDGSSPELCAEVERIVRDAYVGHKAEKSFQPDEIQEYIDDDDDDDDIVHADQAAKTALDFSNIETTAGSLLDFANSLRDSPLGGSPELAGLLLELTS